MTSDQRAALARAILALRGADDAAADVIEKWLAPPKEEVWRFPVGPKVMAHIVLTGEPDSTVVDADTYRHLIEVFQMGLRRFEHE